MVILGLVIARGWNYKPLSEDEIAIICPNQSNHHGGADNKESFNINTAGRGARCFACGFSMSPEGLLRWLAGENIDDETFQLMATRSKLQRLTQAQNAPLVEEKREIFFPPGEPWDEGGYRGISLETYHKVGAVRVTRGRYRDRIAFPVVFNGELLGVDARALIPDLFPKYLRNKGSSCGVNWLWPYDIVKAAKPKLVTLGEGLFHSLNAHDKGYHGLCMFGVNNWSATKLRMVLATGADEVCFFRDPDLAGMQAEQLVCSELREWIKVTVAAVTEEQANEGKDQGDLSQSEMDEAIANRYEPDLPRCLPHNDPKYRPRYDERCTNSRCSHNVARTCMNLIWAKKKG